MVGLIVRFSRTRYREIVHLPTQSRLSAPAGALPLFLRPAVVWVTRPSPSGYCPSSADRGSNRFVACAFIALYPRLTNPE